MKNLFAKHKFYWSQPNFVQSALVGLIFFAFSIAFNYCANVYARAQAGAPVGDLLLSYLPSWNMNLVVIQGALLVVIFVLCLVVREPSRLPFVLKSAGLAILIRAIFVSLTHLGPPPEATVIAVSPWLGNIGLGTPADLFFSGHTGLPFLLALVFWQNLKLRIIFLSVSFVFGASVLLGHLHYSIDVLAAWFIAYGIYRLSLNFFAADWTLLSSLDDTVQENSKK